VNEPPDAGFTDRIDNIPRTLHVDTMKGLPLKTPRKDDTDQMDGGFGKIGGTFQRLPVVQAADDRSQLIRVCARMLSGKPVDGSNQADRPQTTSEQFTYYVSTDKARGPGHHDPSNVRRFAHAGSPSGGKLDTVKS
jgi:hypothetical protein